MTAQSLKLLNHLPMLDPASLHESTQKAIAEIVSEGESRNTRNSYKSAMKYWAVWYRMRYNQDFALPLQAPVVLQFIVDHALRYTASGETIGLPAELDIFLVENKFKAKKGHFSIATLLHRLAVLSKAHKVAFANPNPCKDPRVQELIGKTQKAYAKKGMYAIKRPALTKEPLVQIINTCDQSLKGLRDKALILFAWASGGRRRSEVSDAHFDRLIHKPDMGEYLYLLLYSKTNQTGQASASAYKPISGLAAQALADWIAASQLNSGYIFRQINKGGVIGEKLSPVSVNNIIKSRCKLAGLSDEFTAHSLRSGFVTEAAKQNIPIAETMLMTGHQNINTLMGYYREANVLESKAAKLLDNFTE
ncbi:site-specific integrase [Advenella sp. RU8]|uniref:site-specific integrase n=1 Tax=Advenella sp. RU8 TaxID=3399575 RepID=UPI003AACD2A5